MPAERTRSRSRSGPGRGGETYFVAAFQGMGQTGCSDNYELALLRSFEAEIKRLRPSAAVMSRCFTPPPPERKWVTYEAAPGETHRETTRVPRLQQELEDTMDRSGAWTWFEGLPSDAFGAVVGVSNGGKPASAAALWFDGKSHRGEERGRAAVEAMALVSSLPETEQQQSLAHNFVGARGKKIFMTVCEDEPWGVDKMYAFAGRVLADVKGFRGRKCHAAEPTWLMEKLGSHLARQVLRSSLS